MPALNFSAQFADAVRDGLKTQTIRAPRKHPIRVNDTVYLYTGMRTKNCRKLGEGTVFATSLICIHPLFYDDDFARADGFKDSAAMVEWFRDTHGLPFVGTVIRWKLV